MSTSDTKTPAEHEAEDILTRHFADLNVMFHPFTGIRGMSIDFANDKLLLTGPESVLEVPLSAVLPYFRRTDEQEKSKTTAPQTH